MIADSSRYRRSYCRESEISDKTDADGERTQKSEKTVTTPKGANEKPHADNIRMPPVEGGKSGLSGYKLP